MVILVALLLLVAYLATGDAHLQQGPAQSRQELSISARKFEFSPTRIDARVGDIIKITLVAEDIPHTFTLDAFRISKRASPGQPATFEFRVDHEGTFTFYCALTIDDGCKAMKGELVVSAQRP
jgi:cytochrome c oxidase subunit 2